MSDLNVFYDKLNAAFSKQHLTESAKEAAIYDFVQRARERDLSFAQASDELENPQEINRSVTVGLNADEQTPSSATPTLDVAQTVQVIRSDISDIRNAVIQFVAVSQHTAQMLVGIGQAVDETNTHATDNKRTIGEVRTAAGELKDNLAQAIATTQGIVNRLDTIPARLDSQLQKIEALEGGVRTAAQGIDTANTTIKTVAGQTNPQKTHKENVIMTTHSVVWGAVAGTLLSAGVGAAINHYSEKSKKPPEPQVIEKIVPAEPKTFVLRDGKGKTYTLEVDSNPKPEQKVKPSHPMPQVNKPFRQHLRQQ